MIIRALRFILQKLYDVKVTGLDNLAAAGPRSIIVANHLSFLDAILLAIFLPEKPFFAINTQIAQVWWVRPVLRLFRTFAVDPTNPMATKSLIGEVRKGERLVIFPEGRITVTGALMKVYEGPGMIADKADAMIVPVRIDGAQYTPFSRLRGKVRIRMFPRITLNILKPCRLEVAPELTGRARRAATSRALYDLMTEMIFKSSEYRTTLFQGLLDAAAIHGKGRQIIEDIQRKPLTYRALLTKSIVLGRVLAKGHDFQRPVGLMLPNSVAAIATFFALQSQGAVPAMINFSSGINNIISSCNTARVQRVITSRKFIEMAKLDAIISALTSANIEVSYLEDVALKIGIADKLFGLTVSLWPAAWYYFAHTNKDPDDSAVVLFTSGSEGTPKGVVLSHANILANRFQLASRVDFGPGDKVFNALPIFHSFGLTAGTILPLLSGISTFFYPSPLHYRIVPVLVYDLNATILFGTDTFLSGYARFAHPYDFYSVRYIFAGAEKLKDETRRIYSEKYGVRVFEGYGATETAPVLATNTPMQYKAGTVGCLLPGLRYQLKPVPGIDAGGVLSVQGPNIMKGYLLAAEPGILQEPAGGWYETGDIVDVDHEGYITIRGRAKRFAKIGGEMVSLTAAEAIATKAYPNAAHAVVSIPDARKGEVLVLFTTQSDASTEQLVTAGRERGDMELAVPKLIKVIQQLPVLGTGKTDYVTLQKLALGG